MTAQQRSRERGTMVTMRPTDPRDRAFEDLYASTVDDIIRFLQRRVIRSSVEDVAAETFLTVWRRIDDLPTDTSEARAWTFGIARNCALNALRSTGRQDSLAVRIAEHARPGRLVAVTGGPDATDAIETMVDLAAAWRQLPAHDQETLALTALDELSSAQAGQVLGISAAAYRVRLMRARRTLRALLQTTPASLQTQENLS